MRALADIELSTSLTEILLVLKGIPINKDRAGSPMVQQRRH